MAHRIARKLLLIGWDAADWSLLRPLMARGWMPNLKKLVDEGASGSLASLPPLVCPMLWTSAATGKRAHRHGIHGFAEPRSRGDGIRPPASTSRTGKAIWNILSQNGLRTHCINWPASHPAEPINGVCISNRFAVLPKAPGRAWPSLESIVHPPSLANALSPLRMRPEELEAATLLPFIPKAAAIDQQSDPRLVACAMLVARASTIHNATTWVLENHPWDFAAVLYDGIELFCQRFVDYHPPRQPSTSPQDLGIYQHVVTAACCFHDMMLGRLLQLAGSDTNVLLVSDHGYHSGEKRPRSSLTTSQGVEAVHRPQGIWVMHGPRVSRGASVVGASLLDVTPTGLMLMGVSSGMDMEGRPWVEAIADAGAAELETDRIISWDSIAGADGMHPPRPSAEPLDDAESQEAIEHLLALGYVEPPPSDAVSETVAGTRKENQFNLARAFMNAGQFTRAIELLELLVQAHPKRLDYAQTLFRACIAVARYKQARSVVDASIAQGAPAMLTHLALGMLELAERRPAVALEHLRQATEGNGVTGEVHVLIGQGYLRLRRWSDAEAAFSRALEMDPDNAAAWHGRAVVALAQERNEQAIELALRAVELRPDYPEAHYHLGVALSSMGKPDEAAIALKRCLALRPRMLAPYRALAELYDVPLKDPVQARVYRREAREIILQRRMNRPRP